MQRHSTVFNDGKPKIVGGEGTSFLQLELKSIGRALDVEKDSKKNVRVARLVWDCQGNLRFWAKKYLKFSTKFFFS